MASHRRAGFPLTSNHDVENRAALCRTWSHDPSTNARPIQIGSSKIAQDESSYRHVFQQGRDPTSVCTFGAIGEPIRKSSAAQRSDETALRSHSADDSASAVSNISPESLKSNPFEGFVDTNPYEERSQNDLTATLLARLRAQQAFESATGVSKSALTTSSSDQATACRLDRMSSYPAPSFSNDANARIPIRSSDELLTSAAAADSACIRRNMIASAAEFARREQEEVQERLVKMTVDQVLDTSGDVGSSYNAFVGRRGSTFTPPLRAPVGPSYQPGTRSQHIVSRYHKQSLPQSQHGAQAGGATSNSVSPWQLQPNQKWNVGLGANTIGLERHHTDSTPHGNYTYSTQNLPLVNGDAYHRRPDGSSVLSRRLQFAEGASLAGQRLAHPTSLCAERASSTVTLLPLTIDTARASAWSSAAGFPNVSSSIPVYRSTLSPTASEFSIEQGWLEDYDRPRTHDDTPHNDSRHRGVNLPRHGTSRTEERNRSQKFAPAGHASGHGRPFGIVDEPVNYSQLLEETNSFDCTQLVTRIIRENNQQASIFLQQKLKVGSTTQKDSILAAIVDQLYGLMTNRFGNFLVQRCFDHADSAHIRVIADAMLGRVVQLSMDAFACHVVQKAFDHVSELHKAAMVHELLEKVPETVMHRFSCHVWQKLFELRWTIDPPLIMLHVNQALEGQWERVALGETGSLVVQNIFENCLDEDKRPVVEEVLLHIDHISRGQFGNWCIQHLCEHGGPRDRDRAIDHILRMAFDYSVDQYASKVIEKMLKLGDDSFLDRYLEQICQIQTGRPRIPLIDIAGDQYGNYLIQYIMDFTTPKHREVVAAHVRRHMVSLRGSKFGSRVAARCCDPERQIRPGPPSRTSTGRYHHGGAFGYHQTNSAMSFYR